jgi:hypothetical protein
MINIQSLVSCEINNWKKQSSIIDRQQRQPKHENEYIRLYVSEIILMLRTYGIRGIQLLALKQQQRNNRCVASFEGWWHTEEDLRLYVLVILSMHSNDVNWMDDMNWMDAEKNSCNMAIFLFYFLSVGPAIAWCIPSATRLSTRFWS